MYYRNFNDNELVMFVSENNEEAKTILFEKYRPLIISLANKMHKTTSYNGLEVNDFIQEGYIGLSNAMTYYSDDKDASFYTFAKTCIERRMISLIISTKRLKHKVLNESISLQANTSENFSLEMLIGDSDVDPLNLILDNEAKDELINKIKDKLTDFEEQVFLLKINNFNYREIAQLLDKKPKAIDNALQRIKVKAKDSI